MVDEEGAEGNARPCSSEVVGLRSWNPFCHHAWDILIRANEGSRFNVQGTARSSNPLQHKAETPHAGMHSRLEACLARPTHILFWTCRSTFYNEPICRAPRSILILQHVSGHKSTPQASLALTQNLTSIRVGCSCGARLGCGIVCITYIACEDIMIIDSSFQETLLRWYTQTGESPTFTISLCMGGIR